MKELSTLTRKEEGVLIDSELAYAELKVTGLNESVF